MKREISKLHEDIAKYSITGNHFSEHHIKLMEFQIRLVEIVKQLIEKTERVKKK